MLVGVREYRREEMQRICGLPGEALASHYTLLRGRNEATLTDVTDTRARKVIHFDYYATAARSLFAEAVGPIMHAVLPPVSSPQVVVVVDGTEITRFHTLLDEEEGLLAQCWSLMMTEEDFEHVLDTIYVAMVELDDNNHLRDIAEAAAVGEPTIIEDADDHFTSVEDVSYTALRGEPDLRALLQHAQRATSAGRHQIFSFILVYKAATGLPNSTIQFVSLAVSELARGMRSTRHCITTAASLIESRSPSITFAGTKLSYLLKPALLGKQPGLWISCFAPTSPSNVKQRETFKESFCIAYTSCRVYGSRVAVDISDASQLANGSERRHLFNSSDECVEMHPRTDVPQPSASALLRKPKRHATHGTPLPSSTSPIAAVKTNASRRRTNGPSCGEASALSPLATARDTMAGLLITPSGRRTDYIDDRSRTESRARDSSTARRQSSRPLYSRCSSLEKHPYNCSARYELETYKRVMEPAMDQLRRDIQHYATQLEEARRQIRRAKRGKSAEIETEQLRASLAGAIQQRESLEEDFVRREKDLHAEVRRLQDWCNDLTRELQLRAATTVQKNEEGQKQQRQRQSVAVQTPGSFLPVPPNPPPTAEDLVASHARPEQLQSRTESADVHRASQWIEVIDYHQQELEGHAERERAYRDRIMRLEEVLSERDAEITQARTELARREQELSLETVKNQQKEHERELERGFTEVMERLRVEVKEAQMANAKSEHRLETCLNDLQQERKRREATEAELHILQTTYSQRMNGDAAKEMVQLLKESYERQYHQLQREVEELRSQKSQQAASKEATPVGNASSASTPRHNSRGRHSAGMLSPAVETREDVVVPVRFPLQIDDPSPSDKTSTQLQVVAAVGDAQRFEDFMKEEPSYTFRIPKALERIRS
ncbi:hypothetical protein DQ04_01021160 [Trypanosoma grayi]|uniref:hypothetical protein n=1 Tax=Trypanosoma grayi TaxID=71804 RepID=UPI0004F4090C|nr:hypothetical protein DQ04_01021160 [Trypanosoma grayi]KEG13415.1 hypothetical protein DQ04_01021160 [Trypanosoma grayi]